MKKGLSFLLVLLMSCQSMQGAKITRIIFASDANPEYLEFWPIVSKAWCKLLDGVRPTLAFIGPADMEIDQTYGDVVQIDPIEGVSTAYQAQVVRLLLPCLFPDDFCLISDIDMVPLQSNYFTKPINKIADNKFVVYRNAAYGLRAPQYPMCYNAAKGSTFSEIFNVSTIEEMQQLMITWQGEGYGWFTDELMLFRCLNAWKKFGRDCVLLGHTVGPRVDRGSQMRFNPRQLTHQKYIDAHCSRPYSKHKEVIDRILRLVGLD